MSKANPDYSGSAVMLTNPPQVIDLLAKYHTEEAILSNLRQQANDAVPRELQELIVAHTQGQFDIEKSIRQAIDEFGSYQDPDKGEYAVKQLKRTKLYSASNFESCFPQFAEAVLTKSINVPVLEGLIKGNLLNEDGLRRAHIIEDKETYAYIIK